MRFALPLYMDFFSKCLPMCQLLFITLFIGGLLNTVCVGRSEDSMCQPSFLHVCPVDETQVISLGDKHTCSQSPLTCPVSFLKFVHLFTSRVETILNLIF